MHGVLQKGEKPDRVYGFRKTSRFGRLFDEVILNPESESKGRILSDILECSPFDEPRDQVLFPFLLLEAKSETGDSFSDAEIQSAFPIKKLLGHTIQVEIRCRRKKPMAIGPLGLVPV